MRLFPTPRYENVQELLDSSQDASAHELETTLRDIRRANIFGLGTWVVKHHLQTLIADLPEGQTLRVLDLATGSADIPQELTRWAEREGREISFVATDLGEPILKVARERIEKAGVGDRVQFSVCDASRLPFADCSFDVVTCSLAFHHLEWRQALAALREMARVARLGFIVNDVYRSQGAWYMAWILAHATSSNRLTRHDGPASVLRAYTPRELRRLSELAGVQIRIYRHPFWRMAAVGEKRKT